MATWTVAGQGTDGSTNQTFASTDRIWLNGTLFGDNITVSAYQDSTHRSNNSDVHHCTSVHINNTKFLTSSTVSINGGGSSTLSGSVPTATQMPFKFNFSDAASAATSGANFYAYDGTTDATGIVGVTVQAIEKGNTSWVAANGLGSALTLQETLLRSHPLPQCAY